MQGPGQRLKLASLIILASQLLIPTASAQSRAEAGAVKGGVAGAVLGGIAGHQNGETAEGIAVGTMVGVIAGSLLGREEDLQAQRQYQYQAYQQQRQDQQRSQAVSMNDVVTLTRSGVSDTLIIDQIRHNGIPRTINVQDVIALHQSGVSEPVIRELQAAPVAGAMPVYSVPMQPYQTAPPILIHAQPHVIYRPYPPRPMHYYPSRQAGFEFHYRR